MLCPLDPDASTPRDAGHGGRLLSIHPALIAAHRVRFTQAIRFLAGDSPARAE